MALSITFPLSASAENKTIEAVTDADVAASSPLPDADRIAELELKFPAVAESLEKNVSVLTISNAHFEDVDGDVIALSEDGNVIENLSTTINSTPGASIEILNRNQVRTTIDPTQYPELQLKCGISALSGGVAGLVATGIGLAAAGVVTGGAAYAILALGAAAGYGTGAAQGGCFG